MVINGDLCWSPTSPEGAQTRQRALTVTTVRASFDIYQSSVPFLSSTIQSRLVWAHLTLAK